jgi:hypothetical protein
VNVGGLICHLARVAILQFPAIPTDQKQFPVFDHEMRELYSNPIIVDALGTEAPDKLPQAIAILAKSAWTLTDRTTLYDIVESLYE